MDDDAWKKLYRKTIGNIRQWFNDNVFHHVSNEIEQIKSSQLKSLLIWCLKKVTQFLVIWMNLRML